MSKIYVLFWEAWKIMKRWSICFYSANWVTTTSIYLDKIDLLAWRRFGLFPRIFFPRLWFSTSFFPRVFFSRVFFLEFTRILRHLHTVDDNDLSKNKKMAKMQPLIYTLNKRFIKYSAIENNLSTWQKFRYCVNLSLYQGRLEC